MQDDIDIKNITEEADITVYEETVEEFVDTDSEGNEKSSQSKIKELREKLKQAEKERNEYLDGWQRAKADKINSDKQALEDKKQIIEFANKRLLNDLVPVMDSFLMAMANKEAWNAVDANWRIGVEYIKTQLETVLESNSLMVYGAVGEMATPDKYSSLETVETDDESKDGTVAEILQYGYMLQGKVLREAKCKTYIIK